MGTLARCMTPSAAENMPSTSSLDKPNSSMDSRSPRSATRASSVEDSSTEEAHCNSWQIRKLLYPCSLRLASRRKSVTVASCKRMVCVKRIVIQSPNRVLVRARSLEALPKFSNRCWAWRILRSRGNKLLPGSDGSANSEKYCNNNFKHSVFPEPVSPERTLLEGIGNHGYVLRTTQS